MNAQSYKLFNNLFIGIFLIGGWLGIHAKASCDFLQEVHIGVNYQINSSDKESPIFPSSLPIHSDYEEETVEEDLEDSDSSDKEGFSIVLFHLSSASTLFEFSQRHFSSALPLYLLFHCWKYNCL
jgi:hypothetical protein